MVKNSYAAPSVVIVIYDDPKHVIVTLNGLTNTYKFVTKFAVFSLTVAWILNIITLSFIPCGVVISKLVGEATFISSVNIISTYGNGIDGTSNDAAWGSSIPSL